MEALEFLVDCIGDLAAKLNEFQFAGVSILMWFLAFIVVGMVVSVFWRGARG